MVREHEVRAHQRHLADGRVVPVRRHRRGSRETAGGLAVAAVAAFVIFGHDHNSAGVGSARSPFAGSGSAPAVPSKVWEPPTTAAAIPLPVPETQPQASAGSGQPHWDGPRLTNYWESRGDCGGGADNSYWVVQPGDSGMYALKIGCFPSSWTHELTNKCQSYGELPAGVCAVWDPDRIMSRYNRHGNLLIVKLTQACLDRAGLAAFHQGPLHQDCVERPAS